MKRILKFFVEAIKSYTSLFLISLIIVFIMTILNMMIPYGIRAYLDIIIENGDWENFIIGLIIFAVYLFAFTIIKICWYVSLDNFGGQYIKDLEHQIEASISHASLKQIDMIGLNKIKHMMYSDLLDVFRVIAHHMPSVFGSLLVIVAVLVLSFAYDAVVTAFIFLSLVIGLSISFFSRKIIAKMAGKTNSALKNFNADTNEFVDLLTLHQTNNVLYYFLNKTTAIIHNFIQIAKREDKIIYFFTGMVNNYNTLFRIALSAFLSLPIINNSIVNLVFFTLLSNTVMEEGQKLEQLIQQIVKSQISFENIEILRNLQPRQSEIMNLDAVRSIKFQNVSFSYQKDGPMIFENVDCEFKKKDCIRLAGGNGSGKSTLIKLILGLYPPTKGSIYFNGTDIRDYSQESLNNEILYLNQEEQFLNTTIKEYLRLISYGDADEDELDRCLQFSNFNLMWDTKIENNGQSLSTGQRKKLLMMKLLLRIERSSVIILDEVEAGLDQPTKEQYYAFISQCCKDTNKIFIVITHEKNNGLIKFNKELQIVDNKIITKKI